MTGPPGAGKTTLAEALAAELGFALFAKDHIKEMLHDTLGEEADLAWSRRLGGASMELLWAWPGVRRRQCLRPTSGPMTRGIGHTHWRWARCQSRCTACVRWRNASADTPSEPRHGMPYT